MHLTPREVDKLIIFTGEVARRRLARGLQLNHPAALVLITETSSGLAGTASRLPRS